jgi:hypothetical protein
MRLIRWAIDPPINHEAPINHEKSARLRLVLLVSWVVQVAEAPGRGDQAGLRGYAEVLAYSPASASTSSTYQVAWL